MTKILITLLSIGIIFSGCVRTEGINSNNLVKPDKYTEEKLSAEILRKGDLFRISGMVSYSNKPSDIGEEYCGISGSDEIEYYYTDIYDKESKWLSKVFYTKGKDTALLRDYVGQKVLVSGVFYADSHGIPYITNISVSYD